MLVHRMKILMMVKWGTGSEDSFCFASVVDMFTSSFLNYAKTCTPIVSVSYAPCCEYSME
jgi:hypothetical protein